MTGAFTAPLSAQQQGLWVTMSLDPDDPVLTVRGGLTLSVESPDVLVVAARRLAARHEALRTTFVAPPGGGVQQLVHPTGTFDPTILAAADAGSFEPTARPPWHLRVTADGVLIEAHHLVADARSCRIWSEELQLCCDTPNASPPGPELQYPDYACSQQEWRASAALRRRIEERAEILAVDRPNLVRPDSSVSARPGGRRMLRTELAADAADALGRQARAHGVSELSTWVAAVSVAFAVRGRGPAVGVLHDGRHDPAWAGVTGCFADITVAACDGIVELERPGWAEPDRTDALRRAHAAVNAALNAVDLPFIDLTAAVHRIRGPGGRVDLGRFGIAIEAAEEWPAESVRSEWVQSAKRLTQSRSIAAQPGDPTPFDVQLTVRPAGRGRASILELGFPAGGWRDDAARALLGRVVEAAERLSGHQPRPARPSRSERVDQLIRAWADRAPTAAAVDADSGGLTYAELVAAADRIAWRIGAHPLGAARRVGLLASRCPGVPAAMLGIWAANATYVPLDPRCPAARLRDTISAAALDLLIVDLAAESVARACVGDDLPALRLEELLDCSAAPEAVGGDPAPTVGAASPGVPAYLMFTSGSTGWPKGVAIGHDALAEVVSAMSSTIGADRTTSWLALTPFTFDISLLELLLPLTVGGRVIIAAEHQVADADTIARLVRRFDVTVVQATPAGWRAILAASAAPFERPPIILCGGEALRHDLARRLVRAGRSVRNVYGPTEATIWAATDPLGDALEPGAGADPGSVPIGRALASAVLSVWDEDGAPVGSGAEGELVIGGPCLADGYVDDPVKTTTQFVRDPDGQRWYRTGDLARELPDGRLVFVGRTDQQVKVRGHRIELGDLETAIRRLPGVADAAADAEPDASGENRLGAVVVPASDHVIEPTAIRRALSDLLPGYLVPSVIRVAPGIPLTPHGKLDRVRLRALLSSGPAADGPDRLRTRADPTRDQLTERVLRHCRALLGRDQVGVDDDFFVLGGHSLLMVQLLSVLRADLAPTLRLRDLFDRPVIGDIVESVRRARSTQPDAASNRLPVMRRLPR